MWFTEYINNMTVFYMHLIEENAIFPIAQDAMLSDIPAFDKVRSYMMNSWCADSQHNLQKYLDGLPRLYSRCFAEDNPCSSDAKSVYDALDIM